MRNSWLMFFITDEMKSARADLDEKYRNMIDVVNSQITINTFMDGGEEEDRPGELSGQEDPLADFVQSINALVKEYKTKMAQSGPINKPGGDDERPGELKTKLFKNVSVSFQYCIPFREPVSKAGSLFMPGLNLKVKETNLK